MRYEQGSVWEDKDEEEGGPAVHKVRKEQENTVVRGYSISGYRR